MTMEERPENFNDIPELSLERVADLVPTELPAPTPPRRLSEADDRDLKERVQTLVKELSEADGSQEMGLVDSITSLGAQTQRRAGSELGLLQARVGQMLSG